MWLFYRGKLSVNYQGCCHFLTENKCFIFYNFFNNKRKNRKGIKHLHVSQSGEVGKGTFQ